MSVPRNPIVCLSGRCLEPSSRDSPYWEEACDTSSREFGKRWLIFDEGSGDVREPDGTEEVDSQVHQTADERYVLTKDESNKKTTEREEMGKWFFLRGLYKYLTASLFRTSRWVLFSKPVRLNEIPLVANFLSLRTPHSVRFLEESSVPGCSKS